MKYSISSAVLIAASASTVGGAAHLINGNWYGSAVDSITYTNWGSPGTYHEVTDMSNGKCEKKKVVSYAGGMSPLDGEVSFHFRGPLHLKQFAFYTPGTSTSKRQLKPTTQQKRHHHAHLHQNRARDEWVTAIINGQVVSWPSENTGTSTAPAAGSTDPPPTQSDTVTSSSSTSTSTPSPHQTNQPHPIAAAGTWTRSAYYNAINTTIDGLVILNNHGGQGSGTFDTTFGASLSYASPDGLSGSSTPNPLLDTLLPDNSEIILYTDHPCTPSNPCPQSRPSTTAYHGFPGSSKLFLLEFSMPFTNKSGFNMDMPAIWVLNAAIPRTQQYGPCSCWPDCGEWDLFEILDSGNDRAKSTLHAGVSGGDSDYFERPTQGTMKAAVVFDGVAGEGRIVRLADDTVFRGSVAEEEIVGWTGSGKRVGSGMEREGMKSKVFRLGES